MHAVFAVLSVDGESSVAGGKPNPAEWRCTVAGDGMNACRMGKGGKSLSGKGKVVLFTDLSTENGDKAVSMQGGGSGGRVRMWGAPAGARCGKCRRFAGCGGDVRGTGRSPAEAGRFFGCDRERAAGGGGGMPRLCGRGTGSGVICRFCRVCRFWRCRPGFPCGSCGF